MKSFPTPDEAQRKKLAKRLAFAHSDRSDDGSVLPRTAAALALDPRQDGGAARLEALVAALACERVIVPVQLEVSLDQGSDAALKRDVMCAETRHDDIDFVRTQTGAGEALVAYSSKDSLKCHRPQDRPMAFDPFRLALVALVETGGRIVVDPGASEVFLPRAAVAALAQKDSWLPAWKDAELLAELRVAARIGEGALVDMRLSYGGEGLVRIELFADASGEEGALRARITRAAQAIVSSQRLGVAADRVEIVPRLAYSV